MLRRCPEEERVEESGEYLVNFWWHEVQRTFFDRIVEDSDLILFHDLFNHHLSEVSYIVYS